MNINAFKQSIRIELSTESYTIIPRGELGNLLPWVEREGKAAKNEGRRDALRAIWKYEKHSPKYFLRWAMACDQALLADLEAKCLEYGSMTLKQHTLYEELKARVEAAEALVAKPEAPVKVAKKRVTKKAA